MSRRSRLIKYAAVVALLCPLLSFAAPEAIVSTNLCELVANPQAFNHKLVKVSGDVTHGYRIFTLTGECKPNSSSVWLEYGGLRDAPSVFNAQQVGQPRLQPLEIEGVSTTLVDDVLFEKFDHLVSSMSDHPQTSATLIGRYFAGHAEQVGEFKLWKGFGPLGCCTLLVIQQIVDIQHSHR